MRINEFIDYVNENTEAASEIGETTVEVELAKYYSDTLIEIEEISDFTECFFEQRGIKGKIMQIDGYNFDEADKSFSIFISEYEYENNLTKTEIDKIYSKMQAFVTHSINGYINENFEPSSDGYGVANFIREKLNEISKFRFYIFSNRVMSDKIKSIEKKEISNIPVELNVWDIRRIYDIHKSNMAKEPIEIDFSEFKIDGLPCIEAVNCESRNYKSYLTAIPGDVLADIYIKYGARLLEGNVRSFLSVRGKVNKDIRKTLLTNPEMFFAYNNGIAATASKVKIKGNIIDKITNLQIINGGQTTASIANVVLQEKADVSKVMVPMKLSLVDDEKAEEMIPIISRCANSQNKVDEADFFANHPYHIRIEELSRKIYAPAMNGNQVQTLWFYERARGQHTQSQMKLTKKQCRNFLERNPKSQVIKKVELAKYLNTYECLPHIVSKGAQFNMRNFATTISKRWEENNAVFNKFYYQKLVSLAILFKSTEKIVSNQDWYKEIKSYRANIVTYSLAVIFNYINKKLKGLTIDFMRIWNKQSIYKELEEQLIITTKEVYDFITRDDRVTLNVTEWCKKEACWDRAKKENWTISENFIKTLISKEQSVSEKIEAYKDQELENELNYEMKVYSIGSQYWNKLLLWGIEKRLITAREQNILMKLSNFEKTGALPTTSQCKAILKTKERLENNGFVLK
ncbi:AIPR family protein [Clostridium perfringens]|uniref:AIPR family protein n=1 Tax=Clostridium perfringens TaxID=1502 RepID=UPI00070D537B|nr:AIPR family protein [Clostridium perfringens]AQW26296.1 hypothetical protein BXT94_05750 [Clostridium perfringens]KAB8119969.1 AIPR family protein [Clostridium perfringens]MBO3337194.1 AIPR family protein [Clostridium perfringens]MBO3384634.1 AIPR family protein [Clostridium perfringens]MBO3418705.1 AIPR family protein [Clostridium perfringens]